MWTGSNEQLFLILLPGDDLQLRAQACCLGLLGQTGEGDEESAVLGGARLKLQPPRAAVGPGVGENQPFSNRRGRPGNFRAPLLPAELSHLKPCVPTNQAETSGIHGHPTRFLGFHKLQAKKLGRFKPNQSSPQPLCAPQHVDCAPRLEASGHTGP